MEGRMEERIKNARNMKQLGIATNLIALSTGLSEDEISKIEC